MNVFSFLVACRLCVVFQCDDNDNQLLEAETLDEVTESENHNDQTTENGEMMESEVLEPHPAAHSVSSSSFHFIWSITNTALGD